MSTPTTPTEGAMRAAERILERFGVTTLYDREVALTIDAETGAAGEALAPQLAQRVKELEDALRKIADHEIDGPLDEWAEAVAYHECKSIASGAIVTSPEALLAQSPTSAQVGTEEITDTRRLDWLEEYLGDWTKNISGPEPKSSGWQFGYNAGPAYAIDGEGETLRAAIDSAMGTKEAT